MSKIYEVRKDEFEFFKKGRRTGFYARGIAINSDVNFVQLELLCNGQKYWVHKNHLVEITENNMDLGRGLNYLDLINYIRRDV